MRPKILYGQFQEITSLKGIGPRIAIGLEKLCGSRIIDLCWHLPSGIIDRRYSPKIANIETGRVATLKVNILEHIKPAHKRLPYKIKVSDSSGILTLVFFRARNEYLLKIFPVGEIRIISGVCERFSNDLQMTHPDKIATIDEIETIKTVDPVYPLTASISLKIFKKAISQALDNLPILDEWLDREYVKKSNWKSWRQSLLEVHNPSSPEDLEPTSSARLRLAYDELLANQLALFLMRSNMQKTVAREIHSNNSLKKKVIAALPFELTPSQKNSEKEISKDMASKYRMLRLLQGDVGCGKTLVALLAMVGAVEGGSQAVIMAPTEILAIQHMSTINSLVTSAGINVQLLIGRERGKKRKTILKNLKSGETQIAVGTHALFQDDVEFKNLGLAVIDEQHRFGVHQRMSLADKGHSVNVLVMTATPIPRTLMLSAYGDMDVSRLTDKPVGRMPIITTKLSLDKIDEAIRGLERQINKGASAYWVCPLIEESDTLNLSAVENRHRELSYIFGKKVGLVHGRMKGTEKDKIMSAFATGEIKVLVATTVIEVGVDVPEATIMVIEHAERFGLSQLHQLRGRVGRGNKSSYCLLLYQTPLGETARKRIDTLRETDDGFEIAEKDLELRGFGEMLGTRQSGLPQFRLADLSVHKDILATARSDAKLILNNDPELVGKRGQALRTLLYLFERDTAVKYLRSG